ncbi:MAG: META domain-containing protein [Patescibacteria group bacterium]
MKRGILVGALVLLVGGGFLYWSQKVPIVAQSDFKNATYQIEGQPVTLVNGRSPAAGVIPAPGSMGTAYFGNEAVGDLNGDGIADTAFLLTQSSSGTGTFYYVAAGIKTAEGYTGTDAVLLGDRIAPQTTEIRNGKLIVNYADRNPGEPMTTAPSLGKTLTLKLDPTALQFGIVAPDFEGEADPSRMTLTMQTWKWVGTRMSDGTSVTPKKSDAFTITFIKDGSTFSATTDCNRIGGNYRVVGNQITISSMMSTMMYCNDSQESEFATPLGEVQSYQFTSKGELVFTLKLDSGTMTFR